MKNHKIFTLACLSIFAILSIRVAYADCNQGGNFFINNLTGLKIKVVVTTAHMCHGSSDQSFSTNPYDNTYDTAEGSTSGITAWLAPDTSNYDSTASYDVYVFNNTILGVESYIKIANIRYYKKPGGPPHIDLSVFMTAPAKVVYNSNAPHISNGLVAGGYDIINTSQTH